MAIKDLASGFTNKNVPEVDEVFKQRRLSNVEAMAPEAQRRKTVTNTGLTGASALTVKQSIVPVLLVTSLFFVRHIVLTILAVLIPA